MAGSDRQNTMEMISYADSLDQEERVDLIEGLADSITSKESAEDLIAAGRAIELQGALLRDRRRSTKRRDAG